MDIETILQQAKTYLPEVDLRAIRKAYHKADEAYQGRLRESGEERIQHALSVADSLVQLGLDASTVAAGLLHEVVEETGISLDDLGKEFGAEIARLVGGMDRLFGFDDTIARPGERRTEHPWCT